MDGVYFLVSLIGVGVVLQWFVANDSVGLTGATRGWFAMDDESAAPKAEPPTRQV